MSSNFDSSATSQEILLTPPPKFVEGQEKSYVKKIATYMKHVANSVNDIGLATKAGYLIDTVRILNLTAANIFANNIITELLKVGLDGRIELDGINQKITIRDGNGTIRVELGRFSATLSDWGIRVSNSAGTIIFQATSATFINGAIITDATITNAKVLNSTLTGSKIANTTIGTTNMGNASINEDKRINSYNQSATFSFGTVNAGKAVGVTNTFSHSLGKIPTVVISINNASFNSVDTVVSFLVGNITTTQIKVDGYYFNNTAFNLNVGNYTVDIDYW